MKRTMATTVAVVLAGVAAQAQALDFRIGQANAELLLEAGIEWASFEEPRTGRTDQDGEATYAARLDLEWIRDDGLTLGLRAEIDDGSRTSEELSRDEIYAYVAGGFGRLEIGEQDGPADVMSFHAPVVALGQVRGDFASYAGSVASLSAADTADAAKLVYLSPPLGGLRFGASYAPEYTVNEDAPDPRRRVVQEDAIEVGVQYETPLPGEWSLGGSLVHARGRAAPETTRQDLSSWSTGIQLRRDGLVLGAAWVDNGDSSDLVQTDEREWNAGVAWRGERGGAGFSAASVRSRGFDNRLLGIGGYRRIGEYVILRADAVRMIERRPTGSGRGFALLVEFAVEL